jgi:hypothetical protein
VTNFTAFMKSTFLYTFLLLGLFGSSQLLKKDTKIYDKIDGDVLFELKDSTKIGLSNIADSWYNSTAVVLVERASWNESDSVVSAGAIIYDADKNEIGKMTQSLKASASRIEDVRKYRKLVWVQLEGYIYNRNIHYSSIPEKGLEKIVNSKSRAGQQELLEEFFETYEFKKVKEGAFTYYVYLDHNATIEDEKPYRVIALFKSESLLYGVVTNDRPFNLVKLKVKKEVGSGTYYFTSKPTDKQFEEISTAVYSYIPL